MAFFLRTKTNNPEIYVDLQKTLNNQSNLEKNEVKRTMPPDFKLYYKSYNNQNTMGLAQKQKHRSIEQMRKPRNKPSFIWSIYDKGGKNNQGKNDSLFNKWLEKIDLDHSLTACTNKHKMD